jgi:hypothetical protein
MRHGGVAIRTMQWMDQQSLAAKISISPIAAGVVLALAD